MPGGLRLSWRSAVAALLTAASLFAPLLAPHASSIDAWLSGTAQPPGTRQVTLPLAAVPDARATGHCGDVWPWPQGSFDAATPPHWRPNASHTGCAVRAFDNDALAACLDGRTVFVQGNSVARGLLFALPSLFAGGPAAPNRAWEKEQCSKTLSGKAAVLAKSARRAQWR